MTNIRNEYEISSVLQAACDVAWEYAHQRKQFGEPIAHFQLIQGKMAGLATLTSKLVEMKDYLENILNGNIQKVNQDIIANMQTILNLLPNLNVEELVKAVLVKTNDLHMVIYLSSLIRSVIALHDLVNNKIRYNEEVELDFDEKKEKTTGKKKLEKADSSSEEKKDEEKSSTEETK